MEVTQAGVEAVAGEETQFGCRAAGGYPVPDIEVPISNYLTILLSTYLHYTQVTGPGVRRGRLEDDGEGGYIQWVTYTGDTADQGAAVTCTVLQVL